MKYGPEATADFINKMTKLSVMVLLKNGMSTNIGELDMPKEAYKRIDEIVEEGSKEVDKMLRDYDEEKEIEILNFTNKLRARVRNVIDDFINKKNNAVEEMMMTGAKGSITNLIPTVGVVGQQVLRDARINNGFEGRLTSHFKKNDLGLKARGFISSSYKQGLNPVEYFLHAASSREGLMDNVIRTPISGYMQRRLSSAMQDLVVNRDLSVRLGSKIIQFEYGEDGLDVSLTDRGELNL